MQVSIEVKPELYKFMDVTASSQRKSISEIIVDKFQPEFDEMQQAKKELDDLLKPAINAIDNGEVIEKSRDEILMVVMESVTESKK